MTLKMYINLNAIQILVAKKSIMQLANAGKKRVNFSDNFSDPEDIKN